MALEQLEAFIRAVREETRLQRLCAGAEAADADAMAAMAREEGYEVHSGDLVRYRDGALVEYCDEDYFMKPRWWE
ncbi:MAG: Nif11 family protein [Synechococcaceae cyanobacterium]|nr:Nif11 family protein [Synechococcaceae cyanobacterium]